MLARSRHEAWHHRGDVIGHLPGQRFDVTAGIVASASAGMVASAKDEVCSVLRGGGLDVFGTDRSHGDGSLSGGSEKSVKKSQKHATWSQKGGKGK